MKALRSSLVLMLVVAAVGGYIYFNERGPAAGAGSTVLLRTNAQAVAAVTLRPARGPQLSLRRRGDSWQIAREGGVAVPAEPSAVQALLAQLQLVQSDTVFRDEPGKRRQFGLDKPRAQMQVAGTTLEFGARPAFAPTLVYTRAGDQIALLPATLQEMAAKPFGQWRDKAILRVDTNAIVQVQIEAPAVSATFAKTASEAGDEWNIVRPVAPAEAGMLATFLQQLARSQTTDFLDDRPNPARWGLDKPLARVRVVDQNGAQTLTIGKKLPARPGAKAMSGGYAAQSSASPAVFRLADATWGFINRPLRAWRSKEVLRLDLAALTTLKMTARGQSRSFVQTEGKWRAAEASHAAPSEQDKVHRAVSDLLVAVQGLRAQDWIDKPAAAATFGFDRPFLQLEFSSSPRSEPQRLQLARAGKVYAAGSTSNSTIFVLPPATLSEFKLNDLFPAPAASVR